MTFQSFINVGIIISSLLLCLCFESSSLDNKDSENLEISCAPGDTCVGRIVADRLEYRSCDCGPSCARHRTCCFDSPYRDVILPPTLEECTWIENINRSIFMTSKCPPLWDGPEKMKELCEGGAMKFADPVSIIPVIDTVSGVTYANVFCSMCNKAVDAVPWNFILTREEHLDQNFRKCAGNFPRTVEYTNINGEWGWGYWHEYVANSKKFIPLILKMKIPYSLRATVTECFRNIVSECAKDWTDEYTKWECESYMAAIEVTNEDDNADLQDTKTYRNIHCAVCNHANNLDKASCKVLDKKASNDSFSTLPGKVSLSFPFQLPNKQCLENLSNTEFMANSKTCRTVVCDPGYRIKNGLCIP